MTHLGRRESALADDGTIAGGKQDALSGFERDGFAPRLHARPLLYQQELSSREIGAGPAQQARELDRKSDAAVEVLVQSVVSIGGVVEKERRGPSLSLAVASGEKRAKALREPLRNTAPTIPVVGDGRESRVERLPKFGHERGKRVGEVFVLPPTEAVLLEGDGGAKVRFRGVKLSQRPAIRAGEKRRKAGVAVGIEGIANCGPVQSGDAPANELNGQSGLSGGHGATVVAHSRFHRNR